MKTAAWVGIAGALVALGLGAAAALRWPDVPMHAPAADPFADQGTLRFPAGTVPLASLKIEPAQQAIMPVDRARQSVRVPSSALVTRGPYSYVFVESEPGVFSRRRVSLSVQDRDYAYVESGVSVGERVVAVGAQLLDSGPVGPR